jgi:hypothetical protein
MVILLGYIAFVFCFFVIGALILFAIEKLLVVTFEALKEYFYPTPKLSEEEANKIFKEASNFIHSKHRPWMHDDTFAEYLALVHELFTKRWNELYGNNEF